MNVNRIKSKVQAEAETKGCSPQNTKLGHKEALPRASDLLLHFGTPNISEKVEATNLKFCTLIEHKGDDRRRIKLADKISRF